VVPESIIGDVVACGINHGMLVEPTMEKIVRRFRSFKKLMMLISSIILDSQEIKSSKFCLN